MKIEGSKDGAMRRVTITSSNWSDCKAWCSQCNAVIAARTNLSVRGMPDRSGWYCSDCLNLLLQLLHERGIEPQRREQTVLIKKGP